MPKDDTMQTKAKPQSLNKEVIVAEALRMADEEGVENISMRKLAGAFNKTAMSLYRYFESIDEIRQHVNALAFTEVDTTPIPGERWDDTIRRTTMSIRQMHLRHHRAHLYRLHETAWSPALKKHTDHVQRLHGNQNIPEEILRRAWRIIDAFLTGFIINEAREIENSSTLPSSEEPVWMVTTAEAYSEQAFRDGIEIIIAGIRNLAAPDPCEWYTP